MKVGAGVTRRAVAAFGASLLVAPNAFAHRAQSVLSSLTWIPSKGAIEAVHRFHADDAELGLSLAGGLEGPVNLNVVRNQARLLVYIEGHFSVFLRNDPIAFEAIGVEQDGREVLAYREARLPSPPSELLIEDEIFLDVFEKQTNLVNVRMGDRTRTLMFTGRDRRKLAANLI